MEDYYWNLFRATGAPVFYLLYRYELGREQEAKTAWCEPQAEML